MGFVFPEVVGLRVLLVIALLGCLAPLVHLGARVEYDDGWFTSTAHAWRRAGQVVDPSWDADRPVPLARRWPGTTLTALAGQVLAPPGWHPVSAARLPFGLAAGLALAILGAGTARAHGPLAGAAAAAYLAWQTFWFLNARTTRPEALVAIPWATCVALVLNRVVHPASWGALGFVMGLGWFVVHPNCLSLPALLCCAWLAVASPRAAPARATAAFGVGALVGLAAYALALGPGWLTGVTPLAAAELADAGRSSSGPYEIVRLLGHWTLFPYRLPVLACALVAGTRARREHAALAVAAVLYLVLHGFTRGTVNLRYLGHLDLMLAPVVGAGLADALGRHERALPALFALALLTGLAVPVEIARADDAATLRAWLDEHVPADRTLIGGLWIAGVAPGRTVRLKAIEPPAVIVLDGVYKEGPAARATFEARGAKLRELARRSSSRLGELVLLDVGAGHATGETRPARP